MLRSSIVCCLVAALSGCGRIGFDDARGGGGGGDGGAGGDGGGGPVPAGLPTAGLVGYWAFDEGQGTSSRDLSGNGRDGVLSDMEPEDWVAGVRGTALDFEDDDYFRYGCANTGCPELRQAIAFWFSADTLGGALVSYFAGERYDSGIHRTIAFSGNFLHVGPGRDLRGAPIGMFSTGRWYHVVVNYEDAASTVYIDGVDVTMPSDDYWNSGSFSVGRRVDDYSAMQYDGRVDELVIYDRSLSQAEIDAVRAATQ